MLFLSVLPSIAWAISVIPGMDEDLYGMDTPAGSGRHLGTPASNVCTVDVLTDSGGAGGSGSLDVDHTTWAEYSGDLRYCLVTVSAPKVIIFETSGYIALTDMIEFGRNSGGSLDDSLCDYTTIAGQTAPSPGITIRNHSINIERNCDHILMQHVRMRHGDSDLTPAEYETWDGLIIDDHASAPSNIVIDHCSFTWCVDETTQMCADDATYSNNIFSEPLHGNKHDKGSHGYGPLQKGWDSNHSQNSAWINNLMSHGEHRHPRLAGGKSIVANNYIYDVESGIMLDDDNNGYIWVSVVANYIEDTDNSSTSRMIEPQMGNDASARIFIGSSAAEANWIVNGLETDPWNSSYVNDCGSFSTCPYPEGVIKNSKEDAIWPTGYAAMTASEAKTYVLSNAGARPADRDTVDTRIINQATTASSTGAWIDTITLTNSDCTGANTPMDCCTGSGTGNCTQNDEAGFPALAENTHSLTLPSNPHTVQASGYTNLEEWLHGYARDVERSYGIFK